MSGQKLEVAVELLTGHTTLRAHTFKLGLTQQLELETVQGRKRRYCTYYLSLSDTWMQKIQNLGSNVLEAQGSRKHKDEWANKPGSQYQAWHNILTTF